MIRNLLLGLEAHAVLTQAMASIVSTMIAVVALIYAIKSLRTLQRQAEASISLTTESFRPVIEVLGGALSKTSQIDFINKGNGAALNFRWKVDEEPERWRAHSSNVIVPLEKGVLKGEIDWTKGLILAYCSVANREEIRTFVTFGQSGYVSNSHEINQGNAVTRLGWTLLDPNCAIPAYHPDFIRTMPRIERLKHWLGLKRGKERRL